MVTILPGLVVGKPLHSRHFTSGEICEKMFTGEFSVLRVKFPLVRVEDVSRAHLQAIKVPEAAGQRFVLNESVTGTVRLPNLWRMCTILKAITLQLMRLPTVLIGVFLFLLKNLPECLALGVSTTTLTTKKLSKSLASSFKTQWRV